MTASANGSIAVPPGGSWDDEHRAEYVRRVVDGAPPLTRIQRDELSRLLAQVEYTHAA